MNGFFRIARFAVVGAMLVGWAPAALAQNHCPLQGSITKNGNPVPDGRPIACEHSGGTSYGETSAGLYACEVDPGPITLVYFGESGVCPDICEGGEDLTCNVNFSVCGQPSLALAAVLPLALYRRRRRSLR